MSNTNPTLQASNPSVQATESTAHTPHTRTDRLNKIREDIQADAQKISPQYLSETIVPEGGE